MCAFLSQALTLYEHTLWDFGGDYTYYNFDEFSSSVSSVTFQQSDPGQLKRFLYGIQINGVSSVVTSTTGVLISDRVPNFQLNGDPLQTLTVPEPIRKVQVWRETDFNQGYFISKVQFELASGALIYVQAPHFNSGNSLFEFPIPASMQFVGFRADVDSTKPPFNTQRMDVLYVCSVLTSLTVAQNAFDAAATTIVNIGDPTGLLIPIATFTQTPACGYVPTITLLADTVPASTPTSQPWLTQFDATNIQVKSDDLSLTLQTYQVQQVTTIGTLSDTQTTFVQFQSCQSAPWASNTVQNMATSVLASPELSPQTFASSKVTFALPCGPISYSLSPTTKTFVTLDSIAKTITVESVSAADEGTHSMILIATLDNYPLNTQTMPFEVTISPPDCSASGAITLDVSTFSKRSIDIYDSLVYNEQLHFTDQMNGQCGGLVLEVQAGSPNYLDLSSDQAGQVQFSLSSTNGPPVAGTSSIRVQAKFDTTPSGTWIATQTIPFEYVDPCKSTTITGNAFAAVTAGLGLGTSGSSEVDLWTDGLPSAYGSGVCGTIDYTHSVTSSPSSYVDATMNSIFSYTYSSTKMTVTVTPTSFLQIGTYQIETCATLHNYAIAPQQCKTSSVTIDCTVTSLQIVQSLDDGPLTDQKHYLDASFTYQYQLTTVQTPDCGYSISQIQVSTNTWSQYYTFQNCPQLAGTFNNGLYNPQPLSSTKNECIGNHMIQVTSVKLSNNQIFTTFTGVNQFQLDIRQTLCQFSVVTATTIPDFSFNAFLPVTTVQLFDTFQLTPPPGATSCSLQPPSNSISKISATANPTTFTIQASGIQFTFQVMADSLNQIGTFNVAVTMQISGCLYGSCSATDQFILTIVDQCTSTPTQLLAPSPMPTNFETSVLLQNSLGQPQAVTMSTGVLKDTVSNSLGSGTGVDVCSARVYSISSSVNTASAPLTASELSIDQSTGLISLVTADNLKIGSHSVIVTVSLSRYPTKRYTIPLTVTINPCILTSFSTKTSIGDKIYGLGQAAKTYSYAGIQLVNQVPACGYQLQVTSNVTAIQKPISVVDGSTISINAYSRDLADVNDYYLAVSTQVVSYPYTSVPLTSPLLLNTQNLKISVIDPCPLSQIQQIVGPAPVENLSAFKGYKELSKQQYVFNDTVSIQYALPTDVRDFCGKKLSWFTINDKNTTMLKLNQKGFIELSPPENSVQIGLLQVKLFVYLEEFPLVVSNSYDFTITIFESASPKIDSQSYKIGDPMLSIDLQKFAIYPEDLSASLNLMGVRSLFVAPYDTNLRKHIDVSSSDLVPMSKYSWLLLIGNNLQVYSLDKLAAGSYQIVIVLEVNDFPQVLPFASFNLNMNYVITSINLTPKVKMVEQYYVLGQHNEPIQLKKYYNLPSISSSYVLSFSFDLISGISIPTAYIDTNLCVFNMTVNDTSLAGNFSIFKFTATTDLSEQVPNSQLTIKVIYKLKDVIKETVNFTFNQTVPIKRNHSLIPPGIKPATIVEITATGLLKIRFYRPIFVPNITDADSQANLTNSSTSRQLQIENKNTSDKECLKKNSLNITLQTSNGTQSVDWYCRYLNELSLGIQLLFQNPIEVSSQQIDQILVKFTDPDYFILSSHDNYLFQDVAQQTLTFQVPPQFASAQTQALFNSIAAASQQVGTGIIILTLLIQIVAKKIITYMWIYYSALQIILLVNQKSNIQMPASVQAIISAVDGIVNLSSLDKKAIAAKIKLDSLFQEGGLLDSLGGVSLAIIGIAVMVVVLILFRCMCYHPKVLQILVKLRDFLFWNFLIRYFQASYINFNFTALTVVFNKGEPVTKVVTSALILAVQYGLVLVIFYILMTNRRSYFRNEMNKKRVGNLYSSFNPERRSKLAFSIMFYVQRSLIVLILVAKLSGGIEWCLILLVLMANSIYLFAVKPYQTPQEAIPDQLNNIILLIFVATQAGMLSLWIEDASQRFINGIYFDVFLGLCLVGNFAYVIWATSRGAILRLKRAHYRFKNKGKIQKAKLAPISGTESVVKDDQSDKKKKNLTELVEKERQGMGIYLKKSQPVSQELRLEDIEDEEAYSQTFSVSNVQQPHYWGVNDTYYQSNNDLLEMQQRAEDNRINGPDIIGMFEREKLRKEEQMRIHLQNNMKADQQTSQRVYQTPRFGQQFVETRPQQQALEILTLKARQPIQENTQIMTISKQVQPQKPIQPAFDPIAWQDQYYKSLDQKQNQLINVETRSFSPILTQSNQLQQSQLVSLQRVSPATNYYPNQQVQHQQQQQSWKQSQQQQQQNLQQNRQVSVKEYYELWEALDNCIPGDKNYERLKLIQQCKRIYPQYPPKPTCFTQLEYSQIVEEQRRKIIAQEAALNKPLFNHLHV